MLRLDKFLADTGAASRQGARQMIRAGRVTVNGEITRQPERKIDPAKDSVSLDGAAIFWQQERYYMLHKPLGVITATEDPQQKTVLDLFPAALRRGLSPAGRLDKDTSGLLLLSTDGDWIHRIISPKGHVPKVYLAETDGTPTQADIQRLSDGITLADGTQCLPAALEILGAGQCRVTVYEGRYHLVRRMLAACGTPVTALHRERIGALCLDAELAPGSFRALTCAEIEAVFSKPAVG